MDRHNGAALASGTIDVLAGAALFHGSRRRSADPGCPPSAMADGTGLLVVLACTTAAVAGLFAVVVGMPW